ncbi:MAG: serine protease [Rhodospirillales bacterium]|nr:serine protease [Rhodospirillales bacterium]
MSAILWLGACSTTVPPAPESTSTPFDSSFSAVVAVYADIPADARSADILGAQRQGSGVLIDNDGLVLTIGYLILDADGIVVVGPEGAQIPADPVAYDHATGFGLIRARGPVGAKALKLGSSKNLNEGAPVLAVSFSGPSPIVAAQVVSRRSFAGYWEYLLENAIFTMPPHHEFGGAALINRQGELVGIGSLMVNDAIVQERPVIGNMFVPIDSLKPILADLIQYGRRKSPVPPWMGVYTDEARGRVYVTRVTEGGPAEQAGLKKGDIIIGVGGKRIGTMTEFFRKVRVQGNAGSQIRLDILPADSKELTINKISVKSLDRNDWPIGN